MSSNLQSVTLADNGTWVCIVSHAGETYTNNLNIQVNGKTLASTKVLAYVFDQKQNLPVWPLGKVKMCVFFSFRGYSTYNVPFPK